ncbi:MAG: UDP-N-acetylglucosamine 1-carboxyvinyltransferase, partial [Patescibacteria group bacterium]|nr:UDP-N-acetylglucosamine 1-carboxyvinyltransferase [Patescibacteria group bacterium]
MAKFIIQGGKPLSGSIRVAGSKNAALPMLSATLLTEEGCTFTNVPDILDVLNFLAILKDLGAEVERKDDTVKISCQNVVKSKPDPKLVASMRASVVLLGALLARTGKVELAFPGGDLIGSRPIDVHLRGFAQMGAKISEGECVELSAKKLSGSELFAESSVTGTENMILAAVLASGQTVIKLAALEPHVTALCEFLNRMGAKISGLNTSTLVIEGIKRLHGAEMEVIPDMIETSTFISLAAATKSRVEILNVDHTQMDAIYHKFSDMGVNFRIDGSSLQILPPQAPYRSAPIRTGLYPNLATDAQPLFGLLATQAQGLSRIHDWIWEGRLGYLSELSKMGASVKLSRCSKATP